MLERTSLKLASFFAALRREDGQGATEYAMVIVFLIVTLAATLGVLGVGITNFLQEVANALGGLI